MDIPHRLREACEAVRRKDFPLADLIPTMQLAADVIDKLREQLQEHATQSRILTAEMVVLRQEVTQIRMREQELAETLMRSPARTGFVRVVDGKRVPEWPFPKGGTK
jgi:hypothetical protein